MDCDTSAKRCGENIALPFKTPDLSHFFKTIKPSSLKTFFLYGVPMKKSMFCSCVDYQAEIRRFDQALVMTT